MRLPSATVRLGTAAAPGSKEFHESERQRLLELKALEISAALVTNQEYVEFLNSGFAEDLDGHLWAAKGNFHYDVDPLVARDGKYSVRVGAECCPASRVTWLGAVEYCNWRSSLSTSYRYRLPTEWEWEYAARGSNARAWPWGDDLPSADRGFSWKVREWDANGQWLLCPVGSYPCNATPEGVLDMMSYPLWEWCSDTCLDDDGHITGKAARGGPVRSAAKLGFLEALFSETQHPGRVWSRWCFDGGAGSVLMGFRVVRETK